MLAIGTGILVGLEGRGAMLASDGECRMVEEKVCHRLVPGRVDEEPDMIADGARLRVREGSC